jgi:quercetin dioxygenase-like cupin family protein
VRRELGGEAFGVNWLKFERGAHVLEHRETSTGQEEVVVIVRGSGTYRIDGEEVPVHAGCFLRLDPEAVRMPTAGPDGMTMIAIGAPRGAYSPHGPF